MCIWHSLAVDHASHPRKISRIFFVCFHTWCKGNGALVVCFQYSRGCGPCFITERDRKNFFVSHTVLGLLLLCVQYFSDYYLCGAAERDCKLLLVPRDAWKVATSTFVQDLDREYEEIVAGRLRSERGRARRVLHVE